MLQLLREKNVELESCIHQNNLLKKNFLKAFELNEQQATKKQLQAKMELLLSAIQMLSKEDTNYSQGHYPLTALEGQARKERAIEEAKGRGFEWNNEK